MNKDKSKLGFKILLFISVSCIIYLSMIDLSQPNILADTSLPLGDFRHDEEYFSDIKFIKELIKALFI